MKLAADLAAKVKLLKFTRDKTGQITDGSIVTAMERHLKALNIVVDEVDALRRKVEQSKFEKGEELTAVAEWGAELHDEMVKTDEAINNLKNTITEVRSDQLVGDRKKEHALKQKGREDHLAFEKR